VANESSSHKYVLLGFFLAQAVDGEERQQLFSDTNTSRTGTKEEYSVVC
jgi:hypothetical protein